MARAGQVEHLPPDVNLAAPDGSVPVPLSKYFGRWSAMWIGGGDRLNQVLIGETALSRKRSAEHNITGLSASKESTPIAQYITVQTISPPS